MFFKQIRMCGDNLSYVIANESTKDAAVVDPGFGTDEPKISLAQQI